MASGRATCTIRSASSTRPSCKPTATTGHRSPRRTVAHSAPSPSPRFATLDDAGWEKVGWSPEGERPYHRFQETRVVDSWIHLQDIRDALLQPEDDHGPGEEIVVNRFESALPYIVGKRMKAPDGTLGPGQPEWTAREVRARSVCVEGRAVALERQHRDTDARDHDTGRALLASGRGAHQRLCVPRRFGDRRPRGPRRWRAPSPTRSSS